MQALEHVKNTFNTEKSTEVDNIINFIEGSERGII